MAGSALERAPSIKPLVDGVPEVHTDDLQSVDRIHGWWHVWEFPAGCFTPLCSCGWIDGDAWFHSRDAALESECPRARR